MIRFHRLAVLGALVCAFLPVGASPAANAPKITMEGNGVVCDLSSHKTFRMKLSGWKPGSTVQIKIFYSNNGTDYPFPLKDQGRVVVNGHGSHKGPAWRCWPNKEYGEEYNVPDKQTRYEVYAFQLRSKDSVHAAATFRVVK